MYEKEATKKKKRKKLGRVTFFFIIQTGQTKKKITKKNGAQPLGKLKGSDQHTHR